MPAKVLVTGSTGFIGRILVRTLQARGDQVRCLVRRWGGNNNVETVLGDVTQPQTLTKALVDVDVVYHLAGATLVRHPLEYRRVNAWGTRHLAQACATRSRPPLVIYLSSLAAAGPALNGQPRSEDDPPVPVSRYGHSKLAGEHALAEVADRVPVTIIRAASTFGPGDTNLLRLFHAAKLGLNGVPGSADVRLSIIHVYDLVSLMLLVVEQGARLKQDTNQGIYFAAIDEQPSLSELGHLAGQLVGRNQVHTVGLSRTFCTLWGHFIDWVVAVTGEPRLLTSDKMREAFAGSWICRNDRAKQELGFEFQFDLREGLRHTADWYRQQGWI